VHIRFASFKAIPKKWKETVGSLVYIYLEMLTGLFDSGTRISAPSEKKLTCVNKTVV